MHDFGQRGVVAHLHQHHLSLVQGLARFLRAAAHGVGHRPHGKALSFAGVHVAAKAHHHPRQGQGFQHPAPFGQNARKAHHRHAGRGIAPLAVTVPGGWGGQGGGLHSHGGGKAGLAQQHPGLLAMVAGKGRAFHVLRVDGEPCGNGHPHRLVGEPAGDGHPAQAAHHVHGQLAAAAGRARRHEQGEFEIAGAGGQGLFRRGTAQFFGQRGDEPVGKDVAVVARHLAQAAQAHGDDPHAGPVPGGQVALAFRRGGETVADAVHLARDGVQQMLAGGQAGHRVCQAGLVQLQVVQAQPGHARQHRRQRAAYPRATNTPSCSP